MQIKKYTGIEAYIELANARTNFKNTTIRQLINGELVKDFHKRTGMVRKIINNRVENNNPIKNLIRFADRDIAIEKTDAKTLKEARILPEGVEVTDMVASFGDTLTSLKLDISLPQGYILSNAQDVVNTFNTMFDLLWNTSTPI